MHFSALFIASAFCFRLASSQALASWYTNLGPQVIYQNASTGDLMYSVDTGSGPGTGGFTSWAKLPLTTPAKAGTSLAGTGFSGGDGNIYGQVYYISNSGAIIQATLQCVLPGGACNLQGSYVISGALATGVVPSSGLAATVRTTLDGYRVLYHDNNGSTFAIQYSYFANISWAAGTPVISDTSEILTTTTTDGGNNLTAYGIDKNGSVLASTLQNNGSWLHLPPIPTKNLTAWDPRNVTLAATVAPTNNLSKTLFYIGTDRSLHQITTLNNWATYTIAPSQSPDIWPLADQSNAPFTQTNNSAGTTLSIFYVSGGDLVQVSLAGGVWQKAVSIFQTTYTAPPSTTSSTNPGGPTHTPSSKNSTHTTAVGVGLGIGLGVPILAMIGALGYFLMRRRRNLMNSSSGGEEVNSPVPEKDPQEVSGFTMVRHEMGGDGREPQFELAGDREYVDGSMEDSWL